MPPPEKDDAQMALALQQRECGLHVNGPVLQLDGMKMLARELEKIQKQRTDNDAKLAQQLHDKLNGHGGVVASGHRGVVASGIGRADAMTDSEFRDWLASGSGSYESRTYAERLEALKRMPL